MSLIEDSIGQGGDFAKGPSTLKGYDTSPSGLGIVPSYLSGGTSLSSAAVSSGVVALASFPPASPADGTNCVLELPSTYDPVGGKKIRWLLVYNAADAVWDFCGGPPLYAEIATSEQTTTLTSYGDLATPGPTITIPRPGDYLISQGAQSGENNASDVAYMAYTGAGLSAIDGDACTTQATSSASQPLVSISRKREKTGLTPGASTVKAQYKISSGGAATWANRLISAVPLRITLARPLKTSRTSATRSISDGVLAVVRGNGVATTVLVSDQTAIDALYDVVANPFLRCS